MIGKFCVLMLLLISYTAIAECIPSGPEVLDNAIDEDCDGWINGTNYSIRSNHPRLYLSDDNIDEIRVRAATHNNETYSNMKDWGDDCYDDVSSLISYHNVPMMRYALLYALGNISGFDYSNYSVEEYGQKALSLYRNNLTTSYTCNAIIALDWIWPLLNQTDKEIALNLSRQYCIMDLSDGASLTYHYDRRDSGANAELEAHRIIPTGFLLYGEGIDDPRAKFYLDFMPSLYIPGPVQMKNLAGTDGGAWSEGIAYSTSYMQDVVKVASLWTHGTDQDLFNLSYHYVRDYPQLLTYALRDYALFTDHTDLIPSGDMDWGRNGMVKSDATNMLCCNPLQFIMYGIVDGYGINNSMSELADWFVNNISLKDVSSTYFMPYDIFHLLWVDECIVPKSPDNLNLSLVKAFGSPDSMYDGKKAGFGSVFMRTNWNHSPESDSIVSLFRSTPWFYMGHQCWWENSFMIGYKGDLAIQSGNYEDSGGYSQDSSYYERTISSNSILVYNPEDDIENFGGFLQHVNGGQRGPYYEMIYSNLNNNSLQKLGGLIKFEDNDIYSLSVGDATKSYNVNTFGEDKEILNKFYRYYVYVKPDIFVVFDRVNAKNATYQKKFILHSINKPIHLDGVDSVVEEVPGANGTEGIYEIINSSMLYTDRDGGRMFIKTLLPQNHKYNLIGNSLLNITTARYGAPYQFASFFNEHNRTLAHSGDEDLANAHNPTWVTYDGVVYPGSYRLREDNSAHPELIDLMGHWRIEVVPWNANNSYREELNTTFLNVLQITDNTTDQMYESRLINGTMSQGTLINNATLIMFSKSVGQLNSTQYSLHGNGNVNHIIVDLYEDTLYYVYDNNTLINVSVTSESGTLSFNSALSGSHDYTITVDPLGPEYNDADSNEDGIISTHEIRTYVSQWQTGSVAISDVIDALSLWKG